MSKIDDIIELIGLVNENLQQADASQAQLSEAITGLIEIAAEQGVQSNIERAAAIGQESDEVNVMVQTAINKLIDVNTAAVEFKEG